MTVLQVENHAVASVVRRQLIIPVSSLFNSSQLFQRAAARGTAYIQLFWHSNSYCPWMHYNTRHFISIITGMMQLSHKTLNRAGFIWTKGTKFSILLPKKSQYVYFRCQKEWQACKMILPTAVVFNASSVPSAQWVWQLFQLSCQQYWQHLDNTAVAQHRLHDHHIGYTVDRTPHTLSGSQPKVWPFLRPAFEFENLISKTL